LTVGIGITTNQFVNPIAFAALSWKLYIVYCCWLGFEFIYIFLFLVETKGKTLEETAALFDGKEVVKNIENGGTEAAHESRHSLVVVEENIGDVEVPKRSSILRWMGRWIEVRRTSKCVLSVVAVLIPRGGDPRLQQA
jgi:hypothetical protein